MTVDGVWLPSDEDLTWLAGHDPERFAELEALIQAELAAHRAAAADAAAAAARQAMTIRWQAEARPNQLPPAGDWFVWLILAGRGFGKTRSGAEWAASKARRYPGCRIALVAPTFADGRDTMVEGESGLLACLADTELRGGTRDSAWNRSLGELYLGNGSRFKVYSSERPRQLRGPQHHFTWGDEPAEWKDADKGARATPETDTTWSNLSIGLRLPVGADWPADYRPQACLTGTPKKRKLLWSRDDANPGLLQQDGVAVTRGRTAENLANLAAEYVARVIRPLEGTRLGRQELDAELLEDVEGALWSDATLEAGRRRIGDVLHTFTQVAVGVDPQAKNKPTSDETGIIVAAADREGHGYVLDDRTVKGSPAEWANAVWQAVLDWDAEGVVVEDNQGGDMVEYTLRSVWATRPEAATRLMPAIKRVSPSGSQSKRARAIPIATRYEQSPPTVHHVLAAGDLALLEEELTTWDGSGDSPNRLDAMVHVLTHLLIPAEQASRAGTVVVGTRWGRAASRR